MNPNRTPAGVPTGGQFQASRRVEAKVTLGRDGDDGREYRDHGFTTVDNCPECGAAMVGFVHLGASGGTPVPGAGCRNCGHEMSHWEAQTETGWMRMDRDGTITHLADGTHPDLDEMIAERGDDTWDEVVGEHFAVPDDVEHAFAERDRLDESEQAPDERYGW